MTWRLDLRDPKYVNKSISGSLGSHVTSNPNFARWSKDHYIAEPSPRMHVSMDQYVTGRRMRTTLGLTDTQGLEVVLGVGDLCTVTRAMCLCATGHSPGAGPFLSPFLPLAPYCHPRELRHRSADPLPVDN
ncbi:hypothetical protein NDU88_002875 [Pleurodeles waltl]|uniref:Uncharacterized protein n=1 Tax=Pleurodeles waltl TaxID=8319 RepID=A0AAV7UBS7_PLEWA|nr:hypothetical protein NDU88_002875 [Pleurodeles waltl]